MTAIIFVGFKLRGGLVGSQAGLFEVCGAKIGTGIDFLEGLDFPLSASFH
jgi:hypothetical protein